MDANVTELWRIVESLQLELTLLRENVTSSGIDVAATASQVDSMTIDMDSLWLMLGSILIVSMQTGFAMLEVGCVEPKHTKDILVKNLLDLAVAASMWWSIGWGVAYGGETDSGDFNQFLGPGSFFTREGGFADEMGNYGTTEGYQWALWLFQMSFSGAAVTIVSGAVGSRITMPGYVLFSQVMSAIIYPVVVRWGWNTFGWASAFSDDALFGCGALDFAGTGVIHSTGGMAALVMVVLTGPFLNRVSDKGGPGSNLEETGATVQTLGAFILCVGWYGFNGCSTLYITGSSHVAAKAMVCTTISAFTAGLGATSASLILYQHVGTSEVINGLLSGLVAITGCCAVVEVEGAFFIGLVSAPLCLAFSRLLELVHIDDMVDAVPVHLANGVWGMIAGGLFASQEGYSAAYYADRAQQCCGWLYGCGTAQLMANVCFLVALLCWTGFTTLLVGYCLRRMGVLRISKTEEQVGLRTVAMKSKDVSPFAKKVLSRIETIASKIGQEEDPTERANSAPRSAFSRGVAVVFAPTSQPPRRMAVFASTSEKPSPADIVTPQTDVLAASVSDDNHKLDEDDGLLNNDATSCDTNPAGWTPSSVRHTARRSTTLSKVLPAVRDPVRKFDVGGDTEDRTTLMVPPPGIAWVDDSATTPSRGFLEQATDVAKPQQARGSGAKEERDA